MPTSSIFSSVSRIHEFKVKPCLDGEDFVTRLVETRGGLFQIHYGWMPNPTTFPGAEFPPLLLLEAIQFLGRLLCSPYNMPGEIKPAYKKWLVDIEKSYITAGHL